MGVPEPYQCCLREPHLLECVGVQSPLSFEIYLLVQAWQVHHTFFLFLLSQQTENKKEGPDACIKGATSGGEQNKRKITHTAAVSLSLVLVAPFSWCPMPPGVFQLHDGVFRGVGKGRRKAELPFLFSLLPFGWFLFD